MSRSIEFWFDFSSGYAYFAAHEIERLAARHGRGVSWRPYLMGTAFKITGSVGLSRTPMKGDYARHDWQRLARLTGLPFALPDHHPVTQLPATRAFYWIERADLGSGRASADLAADFARRVFAAYFGEGLDLRQAETVARLAQPLGIDPDRLLQGVASEEIKALARQRSEEAVAKGVFGSPFFVVDDEPFWGWDRLPMLDEWLRRGGW